MNKNIIKIKQKKPGEMLKDESPFDAGTFHKAFQQIMKAA